MNMSQLLKRGLVAVVLFATVISASLVPARADDIPVVAAASNIKFAIEDIAKAFTAETGKQIRFSFGSSGNFVAQIKNGAPFQLFLSADEHYVDALVKSGMTPNAGVDYAVGKLALVANNGSPLSLDPELKGLKALMAQGKLSRFAIANPAHAPYGERAIQVLKKFDLYQQIEPNLIYGENVSQAGQFAISGSTQGGIVALSLAVVPQFKSRARYIELPADLYAPIVQKMVLTNKAGETAKAFYQFILSPQAREIFKHYGFGLPEKK